MKTRALTPEQAELIRRRRARYSRIGKMRHHRHRALIAALRSDGTFDSQVFVQVCKAFFVLPEDIGLSIQNGG